MVKFINKRTGAIINSPSAINGKNWELLENYQKEVDEKTEIDEEAVEVEAIEEESDEFKSLTVDQIKQELDALGVDYDSKAKKKELYDLMMSQGA